MTLYSFAKLNLALRVLNRRPDGFHEIETIFTTVGLSDRLCLRTCKKIRVTTDDPTVPDGPDNIAYTAAVRMQRDFGVRQGVNIRIYKSIPAGGGLAGGSGNAAAVVRGLLRFWKIRPDKGKIEALLRSLGSDVPYCYFGGTQLGRGRGERLTPLPAFAWPAVVLVFPGIPVPTGWAYTALKRDLTFTEKKANLRSRYREFTKGQLGPGQFLENDFEQPVFRRFPVLRQIRKDFMRFGADGALLSGSGSTLFGLFSSDRKARAAVSAFRKQGFRASFTRPR